MAKKDKFEKLYDRHYHDMLDLNKRFIDSMRRPRVQSPEIQLKAPQKRQTLTKKQKDALARGRKKLALMRSNRSQI